MVKLKKDICKVYPNAIYAWSYHTEYSYRYCNSRTENSFYKKQYCQIPFYSRVHAKHVLITMYGVDALKHVHFVSGKKLRSEGMKIFKHQKYPHQVIFGKEGIRIERYIKSTKSYEKVTIYWGPLKKYIYPPEFIYDKHRRRYFAVLLQRKRKQGILKFNKWYRSQFYGNRDGVSKKQIQINRIRVRESLLQEMPSLKRYRTGDI